MKSQYAFDPMKGFSKITRCTWNDLHYPLTVHYYEKKRRQNPPKLLKRTIEDAKESKDFVDMAIIALSCKMKGISYGVDQGRFFKEEKLDNDTAIQYLDELAAEDRPVLSYKSYPAQILETTGLENITIGDWKLVFQRYRAKQKDHFGEYTLKPDSERTQRLHWDGKINTLISMGYSDVLARKYVRVGRYLPMVYDGDIQRATLTQVTENNAIWQEITTDRHDAITNVLSEHGIVVPMVPHRRHIVYQMVYRLLDKYTDLKVSPSVANNR